MLDKHAATRVCTSHRHVFSAGTSAVLYIISASAAHLDSEGLRVSNFVIDVLSLLQGLLPLDNLCQTLNEEVA